MVCPGPYAELRMRGLSSERKLPIIAALSRPDPKLCARCVALAAKGDWDWEEACCGWGSQIGFPRAGHAEADKTVCARSENLRQIAPDANQGLSRLEEE